MTALERIKEIEEKVAGMIEGSAVDRFWVNEDMIISAKPFRDRYQYLLKAFKVMRDISLRGKYAELHHTETHNSQLCGCYTNIDGSEVVDEEFERRMKENSTQK